MDVLSMMKNRRNSPIPRIKEIVKSFGKFTIDLNYQLREKKTFKSEREYTETMKQRINEYIKNHFKEKGIKNDLKSFFFLILFEFYRIHCNLLEEFDTNKISLTDEIIYSILKMNYDFNEQVLISSEEIYNKITNNKVEYSHIIYLLISLSYIRICDLNDIVFEKEFDLSDISIKLVNTLLLYSKIYTYSQYVAEKNINFFNIVKKSVNDIIPYYIKFFNELLEDSELRSIYILFDGDYLSLLYNIVGEIKIVRKFLFDLYIKLNSIVKDTMKLKRLKMSFLENKCLEGIISNIKKNYTYNNYDSVNDIFNELVYSLTIATAFYDLENVKAIKLEVFNFFTKLLEDLYFTTHKYDDFAETSLNFLQNIFGLAFIDREDIKIRLVNKLEVNTSNSNHSVFRDPEVLEFLLELFEFFNESQKYENSYKIKLSLEKMIERNEFIRKTIFRILLDTDSSLVKYKFLISKTSFCEKVLENLSNFSEEMISYPLSSLLIIMSEQGVDKHYIPEKEFRSILKTLSDCENEEKMKIILKSFKSFLDMSTNNHKLLVQCGFFTKVMDILNKTLFNLESHKESCLSADVLLFLMNILDQILTSNQNYIVYLKDYQILENFFERFINYPNYMNLAYKIWSVCMVNEIESKEILKHSKFLTKRYNLLKEKLKNLNDLEKSQKLIDEFYSIYEIIQTIYLNDNFMKICSTNAENSSNNLLKNIILDFTTLASLIKSIFLSRHKDLVNIDTTKNNEFYFYGFLKSYFKILNIIIINCNKYILKDRLKSVKLESHDKIKVFNFILKKKEIKDIFFKVFTCFQDDQVTLIDLQRIIIDISLHFNDNMLILHDLSPRRTIQDLFTYIKDKINLNEKVDIGLSNIIIENPLFIKFCLISSIRIKNKDLILGLLDCIIFLMKINDGNIKIILSRNFLKYLLHLISIDCYVFYEKLIEFFSTTINFFSTNALDETFLFIINHINNNQLPLNTLINLINSNLYKSRKIKRSVILSNYVIKQPNIFNIIYTGNVRFNYSKYKESNRKISFLSIYISFSYRNYDKISKNESFILFRFESEDKNKDVSLEAIIENNELIIRENDKNLFSTPELLGLLKQAKNISFIFIINKDINTIEIFFNEKLLCTIPSELKYFDFNYTYNILTGFNGSSLKEISNDFYQKFPYVNLSYFMVYADKLTPEKMIYFKLSHISNSKNGTCKSKVNLKYLSKNKYKMFVTNNENQSEALKSIDLQIEPNKVICEILNDKLKIRSNNYIQKLKNDVNFLNNFISKLQRRYSIDIIEKLYVIYIKNTNFTTECINHFSHTYLLTKLNNTDLVSSQNIYEYNNLKNELLINLYHEDSVDISIYNVIFIDYIFVILNDCEDNEIFYSIIKLLKTFLLSNLQYLSKFCNSDQYKIFLIIIYKKVKMLTYEFIDFLFHLAFGLDDLDGISFFNPLFPMIISEILLDFHFFKIIGKNNQLYMLKRIKMYFNPNEFFFIMYESNFQIKVDVLNKIYQFLLLLEIDKEINDELISIVIIILEQTLKIKKGESEPSDLQIEKVTNYTQEFFLISGYFDEISMSHLKYKKKDKDETTKLFVDKNFSKLYGSEIKGIRENILEHFTKIFEDLTNKKNQSVFNSKVQNFLNPAFFLKLYNKEIQQKIPKSKESLSKINMKIIQNISYNEDFTTTVDKNTNLSKFTKSPLIIGQKNSAKDVKFNFGQDVLIPSKKGSEKTSYSSKMEDDFVFISEIGENNQKIKGRAIGEVFFGDNDQECASQSCQVCTFIKEYLGKVLINIIRNYDLYRKMLDNTYKYIFLKDKSFCKDILSQKSFNFSWYLQKSEGPSRIRNKLKAKLDTIKNEELTKKYYESLDLNKCEELNNKKSKSSFNIVFEMEEVKEIIMNLFFLDQIFNINIVKYFIDSDDTFITALNCLYVKDLFQLDCVIVFGNKRIYLLTNVHINTENNICEAKTKFKKFFWVVSDFKDEQERCCSYLNDYNEEIRNQLEKIDLEELKANQSKKRKFNDHLKMNKFKRKQNQFKIIKFEYKQINEIHKRRYLLKQNSLEIFLKNGRNYMIVFNKEKREPIFQLIVKNIILNDNKKLDYNNTNPIFNKSPSQFFSKNIKTIIKKSNGKFIKQERGIIDARLLIEDIQENWSKGIISNYEYLIILNMFSGRSFNDLSQYFILPWILKDYSSEGLNLNTKEIYRDLSRPIHAIDDKNYKKLMQKYTEADDADKFHSGSHYSTPGFISYFLVRLKPYSYVSVEIQGGYFDVADRIFFNIKGLWEVSDKYQELIPEMFFLPELYVNYNEFEFGENQTHVKINDILLPNWAKNEPRLFVKMNKKALESSKVSERIHEWIDLIFGFKQQGKEAVKALNIFRALCYEGKFDMDNLDDREREDRLIEINDFGQIPIQLFSKPHLKKECHQKCYAFYSKPNYLINFAMKEKIFQIDIKSKPIEIKGYYECPEVYLSEGQGGLTSFNLYHDNNEKVSRSVDAYNTFFVIGKNKALLGPDYKNYIDWSEDKYSFAIVKPLKKVSYIFYTQREFPIKTIKPTRNGKKIIVCYKDGFIELFRIHKIKLSPDQLSPDQEKKSLFKFLVKKLKDSPERKKTSTIELIKDRIYPDKKYLNDDQAKDYFIHYNSSFQLNKPGKNLKTFNLKKINENKLINNKITTIEICEPFSLLIIVDSRNIVYLFDLNKFSLIKQINLRQILKIKEKFFLISICHLTGDFVCFSNKFVVLFNINGVLLGLLNLNKHKTYSAITTGLLKSLKNTQSEIYLFTGHHEGNIVMWRLSLNKKFYNEDSQFIQDSSETFYLDSYRLAFNSTYYKENVNKSLEFKHVFDEPFEFSKKINSAVRIIKISEDQSFMIVIHDNKNLCYWYDTNYFRSYSGFFKKIEKSKQEKECNQCGVQINSAKFNCSVCKKKLCSQCKILEIVPEISLKNTSSVCNDCLSMICSTNKMLYDFS